MNQRSGKFFDWEKAEFLFEFFPDLFIVDNSSGRYISKPFVYGRHKTFAFKKRVGIAWR